MVGSGLVRSGFEHATDCFLSEVRPRRPLRRRAGFRFLRNRNRPGLSVRKKPLFLGRALCRLRLRNPPSRVRSSAPNVRGRLRVGLEAPSPGRAGLRPERWDSRVETKTQEGRSTQEERIDVFIRRSLLGAALVMLGVGLMVPRVSDMEDAK